MRHAVVSESGNGHGHVTFVTDRLAQRTYDTRVSVPRLRVHSLKSSGTIP